MATEKVLIFYVLLPFSRIVVYNNGYLEIVVKL